MRSILLMLLCAILCGADQLPMKYRGAVIPVKDKHSADEEWSEYSGAGEQEVAFYFGPEGWWYGRRRPGQLFKTVHAGSGRSPIVRMTFKNGDVWMLGAGPTADTYLLRKMGEDLDYWLVCKIRRW